MSEQKKFLVEEDGVLKVRTCAWSPPGDHPVSCGLIITVSTPLTARPEVG